MKTITFDDPHRRRHFEFFRNMDQPHFNITANIEITGLLKNIKEKGWSFTPVIVYYLSRTANEIPEFRQRIREDRVVEHERVHPSFTVLTEVSTVFSFCEVKYRPDLNSFLQTAQQRVDQMQQAPSFEDEEGRDDYLFLSSFPWVSFTGFQHAMHYTPADSVPRIAWGKFFQDRERVLMPLSVQAHHALVDGRHMGAYFEKLQMLLAATDLW